jgi:hypothetical protein
MRPGKQAATTEVAQTTPVLRSNFDATASPAADQTLPVSTNNDTVANNLDLSDGEMAAYRQGFNDGVKAAREGTLSSQSLAAPAPRTVTRTRYVRNGGSSSRRVYYDYNERPRGRSFWQKHRDKLTVAMGAGGGAIIGGLVGGKKGAAIGALAGGGGSALYTYKLRKRNRNY